MTPRLDRTTRPLARAVGQCLSCLGINALGSPTTIVLIGSYVTGLILLHTRPTQTRVSRSLPARCHDALNRLLRLTPLSTRAIMALPLAWAKRRLPGYLCLDDVVVERSFARKLPWAGWTYSFATKRKVYGVHVVVLLWCSHDGRWRIPVAFRLWPPKRSVGKRDYRTKLQLAEQMLREVLTANLRVDYLVFDTHYTAGWFTKLVGRLGLVWAGTLGPRTYVVWRGKKLPVRDLAPRLSLTWRPHLGLRAVAPRVHAPTFGPLQLVVTRIRHGNCEYLVSNDLHADLTTLVVRKRSR